MIISQKFDLFGLLSHATLSQQVGVLLTGPVRSDYTTASDLFGQASALVLFRKQKTLNVAENPSEQQYTFAQTASIKNMPGQQSTLYIEGPAGAELVSHVIPKHISMETTPISSISGVTGAEMAQYYSCFGRGNFQEAVVLNTRDSTAIECDFGKPVHLRRLCAFSIQQLTPTSSKMQYQNLAADWVNFPTQFTSSNSHIDVDVITSRIRLITRSFSYIPRIECYAKDYEEELAVDPLTHMYLVPIGVLSANTADKNVQADFTGLVMNLGQDFTFERAPAFGFPVEVKPFTLTAETTLVESII